MNPADEKDPLDQALETTRRIDDLLSRIGVRRKHLTRGIIAALDDIEAQFERQRGEMRRERG